MPASDSTAPLGRSRLRHRRHNPVGSVTGKRPAPIAADIGSSIRNRPAWRLRFRPDSWIAPRSTGVEPDGTPDDDMQVMWQSWIVGCATLRMNMLDHRLSYLEIGDDAVAQRPDGLNVTGVRPSRASVCIPRRRQGPVFCADAGDSTTDGSFRTIPMTFHRDDGVCRAEVDRHVGRKQPQHSSKNMTATRSKKGNPRSDWPRIQWACHQHLCGVPATASEPAPLLHADKRNP